MGSPQRKEFLELLLQSHGLGSALPSVLPQRREVLSTGISPLDTLLWGGFPRGHISEVIGPVSSGKTSLLFSLLSSATQQGEVVACIDANTLDPFSANRGEIDLKKLLWVRCQRADQVLKTADILCRAGNFGVIAMDLHPGRSSGDPSPDGGQPSAVSRQRSAGGGQWSAVSGQRSVSGQETASRGPRTADPWQQSTDLWFRLQRAVEGTRTVLLVIAGRPVVRHVARCSLRLRRNDLHWFGRQPFWKLWGGFSLEARVARGP